ncbi:MAG: M56 family metallopeptidase [Oscillospiraceae bacterium]|nr:M56 family metallopeptidase [Oscillospiraceae bacterium]
MTERLLQMSIQAGALILATTLLRILCLNRLPKAVFPALWAAAVARLLLPFSVSARWSIYGLVHSNGATGTSVSSATGGAAVSVTVQQTTPVGPALYMSAISVAVQIYLGIAAALLLAFALLYVRSFCRFRTAVPVSSDCAVDAWKASHRLLRSLCILRSPATETPLAMGILRPKIILPAALDVKPRQLDYILTHEYCHLRRFDPLLKALALCAAALHWFNPFVWLMLVLLNRDIELACDASVLRRTGGARRDYALSLLEMAGANPAETACSFNTNQTQERIVSIMKYKKATHRNILIGLALIVCLSAVFITDAVAEDETAPAAGAEDATLTPLPTAEPVEAPGSDVFVQSADGNATIYNGNQFAPYDVSFVRGVVSFDGEGGWTLDNADMGLPVNPGSADGTWALLAGQTVTLTLDIAPGPYEGDAWNFAFGYIKSDAATLLAVTPELSGSNALSFAVPEDGDYTLFLINISASPVEICSYRVAIDTSEPDASYTLADVTGVSLPVPEDGNYTFFLMNDSAVAVTVNCTISSDSSEAK